MTCRLLSFGVWEVAKCQAIWRRLELYRAIGNVAIGQEPEPILQGAASKV